MYRHDANRRSICSSVVGNGKIAVLARHGSVKLSSPIGSWTSLSNERFGLKTQPGLSHREECDPMKKIVVLAAVAIGALAVAFSAVAIPREATACSRACINCCN